MLVVTSAALTAAWCGCAPDGVGIVETDKTHARVVVQSERITQAMRPVRRRRHALDCELDPMLPGRIDDQYLTVEVQESVQTGITILLLTHLSDVITY